MVNRETPLQRTLYRWARVALVLVTLFLLVWVQRTSGTSGLAKLLGLAGTSLAVVGRFIIFAGLREGDFGPWDLALMVWLVDLCVAFLLTDGLETLERVPRLGALLVRLREKAREVMARYPGFKRMAFFGVVLWVALPLGGTGAITGSFAARFAGLTRPEGVLAIAIGSAATALAFAGLAVGLGESAEDLLKNPYLLASLVLALLVAGRLAYLRVMRALRQA